MFKTYYALTKPGIIYGNGVTTTAGFLLASKGHIGWWLFVATLGGISLVIASACVFNNYIDRDIDARMARTRQRAIVSGSVSGTSALVYATALGLIGAVILAVFTNLLTLVTALAGLFIYVVLYGIFKRRSVYGTAVGSIAGAVPPVAGYLAVSERVDGGALILLAILVFWQMPHFYAIAIYRLKDYKSAGLPVWPVKNGIAKTKIQILLFVCGFVVAAQLLALLGYTGIIYFVSATALGFYWLWIGLRGFKIGNSQRWARQMFSASLIVITLLSVAISLSAWLP